MSRSRDWCFTWNSPTEPWVDVLRSKCAGHKLKYLVGQLERGQSGNVHVQGYIEFSEGVSMSTCLRNLPEGCHVEKRKGTRDQARLYCQKPESRIGQTLEIGNFAVQGYTCCFIVNDLILKMSGNWLKEDLPLMQSLRNSLEIVSDMQKQSGNLLAKGSLTVVGKRKFSCIMDLLSPVKPEQLMNGFLVLTSNPIISGGMATIQQNTKPSYGMTGTPPLSRTKRCCESVIGTPLSLKSNVGLLSSLPNESFSPISDLSMLLDTHGIQMSGDDVSQVSKSSTDSMELNSPPQAQTSSGPFNCPAAPRKGPFMRFESDDDNWTIARAPCPSVIPAAKASDWVPPAIFRDKAEFNAFKKYFKS